MKLYLSSLMPSHPDSIAALAGGKQHLRVGLISNAWDPYPVTRREAQIRQTSHSWRRFGCTVKVVDLRNQDPSHCERELSDCELVWVMGGNSFYLNYLMHRVQFSLTMKQLARQGAIYGGESAGAVVAGTTLHGIEYLDDPLAAPTALWEGLKFLTFGIIPHWESPQYSDALHQAKQTMEHYAPVAHISNDQALVIDGEELEAITQ